MATKDFTVSENNDRGAEGKETPGEKRQALSKEEKSTPGTEVKNAHATGDGSFGRNDGSLPEKEEDAPANDNTY